MRKILGAFALSALLVVSLAACSSSSDSAASSCGATKPGSSSDRVKVSGKFGAEPKVTFGKGLTTKNTERTVLVTGKGTPAKTNSIVTLNYSVYNGSTGKLIDTTGFGKSKAVSLTVDKGQVIPGLYDAVYCATPGTRVAVVIPPKDAFGSAGQQSLGIGAKDAVIFVLDVDTVKAAAKALKKANGTPQAAPAGFPTVTLAANGAPTITMPTTPAPTTTQIADLKKGSGTTVKSGDTVTVQYTGAIYATGKVFDSSWSRGTPATFPTTGVIKGFGEALVGQKVGSQVIAVIPPKDGYGDTPPASSGISKTDTLVFVVDILATS